jgi:hypothetical protein
MKKVGPKPTFGKNCSTKNVAIHYHAIPAWRKGKFGGPGLTGTGSPLDVARRNYPE